MSEIVFEVTEDNTDGGSIARALGYSIVTEADASEQLRVNVREAVLCHFDEAKPRPPSACIANWLRWHEAAARQWLGLTSQLSF